MKDAAKVLDFERAMELRDIIMELQGAKNRYTFQSTCSKRSFKDIDEHHGRAFSSWRNRSGYVDLQ